ncbi:hypothetical protein RND81_10G048500 [Saponaria officinalis]|uniref:Uncharacterized protein n=1 Tax=Saponaria officinalis TaxID=3572 RepID=A0AAW1I0F1_SAPOF
MFDQLSIRIFSIGFSGSGLFCQEQEVIEDIQPINIVVPNRTHLCNLNEEQNYEKGSSETTDEEILRKVDSDVDIEEPIDVDDEVSSHEGDKIDSGSDVEGMRTSTRIFFYQHARERCDQLAS